MSPTTSGRAGGVATIEAPDTQLREPREIVRSKVRLFAFTAGLSFVPFALIGIAGVAS
jgi:hypothetical protein